MATLEERLAKMRADLKTMQSRAAGAQTGAPATTTRTTGTGANFPAAGGSGAKTGSGASSLDQRLARMRADLQTMKTASRLLGQTGGQAEPDDVPGLSLPTADSFLPETVRNANRDFAARALDNASALDGKTPAGVRMSSVQPEYDRVTAELEKARNDWARATEELNRRQLMNLGPVTEAEQRAVNEAFQRAAGLQKQQEQLAGQMYELRNRQNAARLQSERDVAELTGRALPATAPAAQYDALLDAEDAVRALREIETAGRSGNWDDAGTQAFAEKYGVTREQLQDYANYIYNQSLRGQRGNAAPRAVNGGYQAVLDLLGTLRDQQAGARDALAGAGYDADTLLEWQDRQRRAAQAEQRNQGTADYVSRGWGEAALGSAGTVLANPLLGLEYLGQLTGNIGHNDPGDLSTYRPLDPNRMPMTDFVNTVRSTVSGNIRGQDDNMLRNAAAFLYETGMSVADSSAQLLTLGPVVSLAAMGGSAAAQKTKEVLENGGGNRQALVAGAASGIFEALFEHVSIDKLLAEKSVTGMKSWLKETAKQAGVEASEEIFTEIANMMADAVILGDSSDFNQAVRAYQAQGMSEDDAKRQAILDAVGQVAMAGLGGALSGGMMGGVNNARMGAQNNRILNNAGKGILPDAETAAALSESEAGRDILNQAQGRYEQFQRGVQGAQESVGEGENPQSPPTAEPGQAFKGGENPQSPAAPATAPFAKGAEGRAAGQNETAPQGEAELPRISMADFTDRDSSVWNNVDYDDSQTRNDIQQRVHQEMVEAGQVVRVSESTREKAAESYPDLRDRKKSERTGILKQKISQLKRDLRQFLNGLKGGSYEFEVNGNILEARLYETGVKEVMEKISQDKAGMLYETENIFQNARYLYSTQDYEGDPNIYRWNYFYTPVQIGDETVGVRIAVRDMVRQTDGTADSQIYNWDIKRNTALGGGERGISPDRSDASSAVVSQDAALDGGQRGPKVDSSDASSAVPEDSIAQPGGNVNTGRPAPGVRDLRGQDGGLRLRSILGDEDVEFLDRLGKAAGVAINVVDADGRANGWYQDGQVYITESAARGGENSLVRQVALHEVTHYMKDAAPEEYRRYTEKIAELQGEDLDRAVARVRDEYEAGGVTLNDEEAMDELAAHYTENLLEDRDLFRRLALEDRTLAQRVLDALRRFIERIKGVFTGRQSGQMEQIAQAWADALDQAGANARQGGVEYSEGRRYSIGYDRNNRPFVTVDEDILDGVPRSEWVRTVKNNLREKFPDGVTVGNQEIKIDKQSREEMTYSQYTQKLMKTNPGLYADKLRATNNADEILRASRDWVDEALHHPRKDSVQEFARGTVNLKIGGNNYSADVVVATRKNGELLLYDLLNLKQTAINEKSLTRQATHPASAEADRWTASDFDPSVAQSGEEVNPRRELTFQEEVRRQLTGEDPRDAENRRAYSLQGTEGLGKELHELRRQNQRLEEAENAAPAPAMTDQEAKTEARRLLLEIGSQADLEETAGLLQALYNRMSETGAKPNDSATRQAAETIARNILDSASETDDAMWRDYESLRKFLKDTKIKVPRDAWGGLDVAGGYNEFRKQYFGRLNLSSTEGRSIDDVYSELSGEYPGLFDEDAHPNPEDQILQIAEVLDAIRPETFNPYAGDSAGAADWLAGEILERYYDRRTDRRVSEAVKNERQRGLERQKRRLKQVRDQRDQKIKAIKEKNRQAARKARERQNTAQVRDRVYRHAKALSRKLLNPRDDFRVPEKLRGYTLALLDDLDLGSGFGYEFTTEGKFKRVALVDENGKPVGANVEPTSRTEAAMQLKKALEELANSEEYELAIDPDLADKLNEIAEMKGVPVGGMTRAQAETVWEALKALEHAITNADKTLGQSKYKKISDMAEAIRSENGDRRDRRNSAVGILDDADKLLNLDMLTPETFLHRLGKAGDALYRQMREAQDKQIKITQEGVKFFHAALKETGLTEKDLQRAERENHDFTVGGATITISTAQLMDLYALFKRKQAQDHITIGGLYFEGGRKGLYKTGQSKPVHVTIEDLGNMLNTLTPAQRGFMDRLQAFMSTTLSGYGNEATEAVYGYWKFKEQNYWPIKVHKTQLKTDPANEAKAKTIPNFSMTKALTPNANNAVTVRSFLDSYTEHLNQMATYAGWLEASENITRLHNFKFTLDGKRTGETVKTLFKKVYGEGGDAYLDNLMQDIAQGTRTGDPAGLTSKLVRNFKVNAVAGNFRVILQQPTAILRAAEVINPVYMAVPGNPLKAIEEAKQWAPIAQWKDWGYFEMGTGRSLRELMVGTEGAMDKFRDFAGKGAGFADNVGWGILWNAVKAETRAQHKDLKTGSSAFYEQCAKRFGEIIDRTQVVDSVLHRTQIMRSGDGLTQMATSFMSEPSKIFNMAARDVYDITHAEKGSPERKRAVRHVARTGIALTASYVVNAAAQAVMDAIRNDDRDKEYSEKFLEAYTGLDGTEETAKDVVLHLLGGNLGQNYLVFGYLPYVKDIQSIIQGYDVSRADMDGVSKFVAAAQSLEKALTGSGKKTALNAGLETAMKGLGLLGLPVDRLKRDLVGLGNTLLLGFGQNEAVYEMDKLMLDVGNSSNASVFYDTLYRAMDGDWMQYQHIYGDMLENGFDPDKINSAMNKRMAQDAGLTKAKNLPMEWAPPGEDADFDTMVQAAGSWLDQTDEDALELARTLDGAELEGDTDSEKNRSAMRLIADQPFSEDVKEMSMETVMSESAYAKYMAARAAGVSTYDYVDFLEAAREANLARGKNGSSLSQEDVEKALNGSRLTAAQKRAIWEAQGWKKESPWG